jgi:hypothetical protein
VLKPRRKPHHVTGPHLLDGAALALNPTEPRDDEKSLAERVRVQKRCARPAGRSPSRPSEIECDLEAAAWTAGTHTENEPLGDNDGCFHRFIPGSVQNQPC